ncbi:beta-glucosidase [Paenibacillus sp. BK033]|uniref:glycoside hydrolase family 3 N-terminal domain-containing protein n=1 Tax=Paenibacillus sp. BK033 TaxID=2512133 RepID=UPI00105332CE|nr:glycoside hydrolase family 3 N-terminal domain-containing protein [Paenibacillus sp. BK033]TCN01265.1 beta-glucosidase [Paenibacillus sp. BK033]
MKEKMQAARRWRELLQANRPTDPIKPRTDKDISEQVEKLLRQLTIDQKIGQMSQCLGSRVSLGGEVESESAEKLLEQGRVGTVLGAMESERIFELQRIAVEISPHGIPLLFNSDIIHGFQTIFPVPLAWSCSWDPEAIKLACEIAAKEATATGITYNHAPMVDISRDPRWGRVVEGAGEDPYLGALIAKAQVEGYQGESLFSEETMIACLKHFAGYGAGEAGRDYNTVDMSERTLRDFYLPPFQAGIEAGAASVMNGFNQYDGIPCAASEFLLKDLLRNELEFDGMIISDYGSIEEIVAHGAAKDSKEAAKLALDATMDIEMVTRAYASHLPTLIKEGKVREEQLDQAVRRILTYKYRIGIMDVPFRYIRPEKEAEYHFHSDHLKASKVLALKSAVLLKNDGVLPLNKSIKRLALIGPFADSKDQLGPWQGTKYHERTITLAGGIRELVPHIELDIVIGCEVNAAIEGGFTAAKMAAQEADAVILALGETWTMSGEAASRMDIGLPSAQRELAEFVAQLGKPTVLVLTNGRPLVFNGLEKKVNAILETWYLGSCAGAAAADILFGEYNPTGRLTMSFPRQEGQIPVYYNHFQTGRPVTESNQHEAFLSKYTDGPNDPLYPFGFGMSYTTFTYSDIRLDKTSLQRGDTILASVTVTNTGSHAGEETVQMYIRDHYGSTVRPVKRLRGFAKITLEPGAAREVSFRITEEDLKYHDKHLRYCAEEGEFSVYIGGNSMEAREAEFELI